MSFEKTIYSLRLSNVVFRQKINLIETNTHKMKDRYVKNSLSSMVTMILDG